MMTHSLEFRNVYVKRVFSLTEHMNHNFKYFGLLFFKMPTLNV